MKWMLCRIGFGVGVGAGIAWLIAELPLPWWISPLGGALSGAGFFVLMGLVAEAWRRADRLIAEAKAESFALADALGPKADEAPVMTKRVERIDPFDNVSDLLDRTAEVPAPKRATVLGPYLYRGNRRQRKPANRGGAS